MSADFPFPPDDLPSLPEPPLPEWLLGGDLPPLPAPTLDLPDLPDPPPTERLPDLAALTRTPPPVSRKPLTVPTAPSVRLEQEIIVEPAMDPDGLLAYRTTLQPAAGLMFADCKVSFALPGGLKQVFACRKPAARNGRLHWELGTVRHHAAVGLYVRFPPAPGLGGSRSFSISYQTAADSLLACEPVAPPVVPLGERFAAAVRVRNEGGKASGPVTVTVRPATGNPLTLIVPAVEPGGERRAEFTLTAATAGAQTWAVTAADDETTATAELTVEAAVPALELALAHPTTVAVDETAELTLTVSNPSAVPARDVTVQMELPVELAFDGSAIGRYNAAAAAVEWTLADLPPNARRELAVRVRGFAPGVTTVKATATPAAGEPATAGGSLMCEIAGPAAVGSALDALLASAPAFAAEERTVHRMEAFGLRHLLFDLAGTRYAVPLANVAEVTRPPAVTPVPGTPDWLDGLANLRGDIVPVVDLARFLGLDPVPAGRPAVLLVQTDDADRTVGLRVDAVAGIRRLPAETADLPAGLGDERVAAFLDGLGESDGRVLPLVSVDRLLRATELAAVA